MEGVQQQDISGLQESQFKNMTSNKVQTGHSKPAKIQVNQQQVQKANRVININKGQQNQSYLTSLLFKEAKIDNISVEIKPFTQQYADLMSVIDQRTIGTQEDALGKVKHTKYGITQKKKSDITQMEDFHRDYNRKRDFLNETSFDLFKELISVLKNKMEELAETKIEKSFISDTEYKFEENLKTKACKSYDDVHSLFKKIQKLQGQSFGGYSNPIQGSDRRNGGQAAYMNSMNSMPNVDQHRQMDIELQQSHLGNNEMVIEENSQAPAFKSKYNQKEIIQFYNEVEVQDVVNIYYQYEEFLRILEDYEKNLEANVSNKIYNKKQQITKLFNEIRKRIHDQLFALPLNYFEQKSKEVMEYYKLPAYTDSNVNVQHYEQSMRDSHKNIIAYQIKFSLEDLRRLTKDQLINDNLLDSYALYLRDANRNMKGPHSRAIKGSEIIIFSHLFFETQYEGMRIKKEEAKAFLDQIYPTENLFNPQFIDRFGFIVNVDLHGIKHWIFLGVYNREKEIVYFDSASGSNSYFKNLTAALQTFFKDISGIGYTTKKLDRCPRQQNGTDCGMFVLKYMQNFAYDTIQDFDQDHITQLRQKLYTFFPMLSFQQQNKKLDYETLQYFEGRFTTDFDSRKPGISNDINKV